MPPRGDSLISVFDGEACYRIVVRGAIPQNWLDRLGDMVVATDCEAQYGPVSVLEGVVRDQTELSGVLESLYRLHVTIIRVERLQPAHDAGGAEIP